MASDEFTQRGVEALEGILDNLDRLGREHIEAPYRNPHDRRGSYDRLGRKVPHRLHWLTLLLAVPGSVERLRRVPAQAVVEGGQDDDGDYAMVACPCGARPLARPAGLAKCAGCERYYVTEDQDAFVFYGEMAIPSLGKREVAPTE